MIAPDFGELIRAVAAAPALRDAALAYAAAGLPVFPVQPRGKTPACPRGFRDATANPATIKRMFRADRNIGIPTGPVSGIWVLDIDGNIGAASLDHLIAEHGGLPATAVVRTGGGGLHYWFSWTCEVRNSAGIVAPGIDVRGAGGFVIVPPSVHESGLAYTWISADNPAIASDWLIELTRKRPTVSEQALATVRPRRHGGGAGGPYGRAALEYETAALAATPPGSRNHRLNRAAFCLYQLVAGGELDGAEVEQRLIDACHRNGLVKDDGLRSVSATIRSGWRAGMQHPRSRGAA